MTKQTTKQQQDGNFIVFLNTAKKAGDKRPSFEGRATDLNGVEYPVTLWAHESPNGVVLSGPVQPVIDNPIEAIKTLAVGGNTGRVTLFTNAAGKEKNAEAPDFFGELVNPDGETARVSAWAKTDKNNNLFLGGNVQPHFEKSEDDLGKQMEDGLKAMGA